MRRAWFAESARRAAPEKDTSPLDDVRARTGVFAHVTTLMKHRPTGTRAARSTISGFVQGIAASLHRTAYLLCGDWHLADDLRYHTSQAAEPHPAAADPSQPD